MMIWNKECSGGFQIYLNCDEFDNDAICNDNDTDDLDDTTDTESGSSSSSSSSLVEKQKPLLGKDKRVSFFLQHLEKQHVEQLKKWAAMKIN